ncbi:hypothetical protein [Kitasatospora sp. CB01950]|uniref:hypothetical protein n=1 Tax=Kitasatospora sp. CB01950 TaxID=1703930 RepID=UPI00093FFD34|nr:hypothetical protein [Kitasatospora sp. CB01950]OKJ06058.1 hypothetical protein AMK19_24075 [Kitasatospora sp. CB01950]
MYGPITGGIPPVAAGGGVLASTGSPGLGLAAAAAAGLLLVGVLLVRRGRLAASGPRSDRPGPDRRP